MVLNRRQFLSGCVLVAGAACLSLSAVAGEVTRPNVVLVLIDDQGYGDLSCHGNPVLKTPNMDALWSEGVRFTNYHVSALCAPTRAALLTGRHCRKVGVHSTNRTEQHMAVEAVSMGELFAGSGYATGIFGKWHLGDHYPLRPMDRGFSESVTFLDGAVSTVPDYWGNDYFDDTYLHNGVPQKYVGYCTDIWFDQALNFIEKNKDRPFFCYLPTNAAHAPFLVPERYMKPYQTRPPMIAAFYGMIACLDENLGRLRKRLSELGLDKNTILIFMTDNGSVAGSGVFNAGMRGHKGSPYDGGHRVPCFFYYPDGGLTGGRDIDQLSAHIDIMPTLADLCRLDSKPEKADFDGISLKPLLMGTGPSDKDRVIIESFRRVVMTQRWRLVDGKELYDIQKDPAQEHDVAGDFPEVVARLTRELDEYRKTEDNRPHTIVIGSDRENPVALTGEDWLRGTRVYQNSIANPIDYDSVGNVWNLQVAQAGTYRFALRRWPKEAETPINALLPKEKWCHQMTQTTALHAVEAGIQIADVDLSQSVNDSTMESAFLLKLDAGPATLRGWFVNKEKKLKSAYYVYVERL